MAGHEDEWVDDDPVPLYALTGGRTHVTSSGQLNLGSLVQAAVAEVDPTSFEPEQVQILRLCRRWLSVAEVSAYFSVPLTVTKVQLGILIDRGAMAVSATTTTSAAPVSRHTLHQVLAGLRAM